MQINEGQNARYWYIFVNGIMAVNFEDQLT